eukprot:403375622
MQYTYCVGISPAICGGVEDLILTPTTTSQTITISNVLRSANAMCYWGLNVNSSWTENTKVNVQLKGIRNMYLSFAIGSSREDAVTVFKYAATNNTIHSFQGNNQILYVLAFPITGQTQTSLTFNYYLSNGEYSPGSEESFYDKNYTMILAVSCAGGGLLLLIFVIIMLKPDIEKAKMITNGVNNSQGPFNNKSNMDDMALSGIPYNYKSNQVAPYFRDQPNTVRLDNLIDDPSLIDQDTQYKNPYTNTQSHYDSAQRFQPMKPKNLGIEYWAKNQPKQINELSDYVPQRKKQ